MKTFLENFKSKNMNFLFRNKLLQFNVSMEMSFDNSTKTLTFDLKSCLRYATLAMPSYIGWQDSSVVESLPND